MCEIRCSVYQSRPNVAVAELTRFAAKKTAVLLIQMNENSRTGVTAWPCEISCPRHNRRHREATPYWSGGPEALVLGGCQGPMVAVGTRISPRPPHRSRRALLTHRAPPSGQTSCDERFSHARRPTRSHYSDRRGISAQCPNRGRLTAGPLG